MRTSLTPVPGDVIRELTQSCTYPGRTHGRAVVDTTRGSILLSNRHRSGEVARPGRPTLVEPQLGIGLGGGLGVVGLHHRHGAVGGLTPQREGQLLHQMVMRETHPAQGQGRP
jgi:hypothetical protein